MPSIYTGSWPVSSDPRCVRSEMAECDGIQIGVGGGLAVVGNVLFPGLRIVCKARDVLHNSIVSVDVMIMICILALLPPYLPMDSAFVSECVPFHRSK